MHLDLLFKRDNVESRIKVAVGVDDVQLAPVLSDFPAALQDNRCVCLLLQDLLQSCARGGGGEWRTCAMRYDEPRLVWTRLTTTH
jgi:hypothetical protein